MSPAEFWAALGIFCAGGGAIARVLYQATMENGKKIDQFNTALDTVRSEARAGRRDLWKDYNEFKLADAREKGKSEVIAALSQRTS